MEHLKIVKTKQAIEEAFLTLLQEKGFQSISVKEIAARANVNRGTFYAHYLDKYHVMELFQETILHELAAEVNNHLAQIAEELQTHREPTVPYKLAVALFTYFNDNHEFIEAIIGPNGDPSFQTKVKDYMWETIVKANQGRFFNEEQALVPLKYIASYIASAHFGIILEWLFSGRHESPEEMARVLSTITVKGPFFAAGLDK